MLTFKVMFRYFCKRILKELNVLVNYFGDLFKFAVILTGVKYTSHKMKGDACEKSKI